MKIILLLHKRNMSERTKQSKRSQSQWKSPKSTNMTTIECEEENGQSEATIFNEKMTHAKFS